MHYSSFSLNNNTLINVWIKSTDPICWQSRPQMQRPGCSRHSSGRCRVCSPCDHSWWANRYKNLHLIDIFIPLPYITCHIIHQLELILHVLIWIALRPSSPLVSLTLGPSCTHFYHRILQTMLSPTPNDNKDNNVKSHCANKFKCTISFYYH